MPTLLVTGAAGFIGSHLVELAIAQGHRVLAVDNLSTGRLANIAHLRSHERFQFVEADANSPVVLGEMVDDADVILHLAATVGVFNVVEHPVATIANNIDMTEAILKAACRQRKRVLVVSTSEVYGKSKDIPFREDGDIVLGTSTMARWGYAASKLIDEFLAFAYWREHRLPVVVVRPFNTIGPRQVGHYGMVVPRLLSQAMAGQRLTVYGDGEQSRCFTYVADVVEWMLRLAFHEQATGQVFNLGSPEEITIRNLAHRIIGLTGSKAGIEFIPYDKAYGEGFEDFARRVPDVNKVVSLTGHSPQFNLDAALFHTWQWLKNEQASGEDAGSGPKS